MNTLALSRNIRPMFAPVLVVLAIFGYLIGVHHDSGATVAAAGSQARAVIPGQSAALEYPSNWKRSSTAPAIPGLELKSPLTLAAEHGGDSATLESGLVADETGPLPNSFLELLKETPAVEILSLPTLQAFRYGPMHVSGYDQTLFLYLVPVAQDKSVLVTCAAGDATSSLLHQCAEIVATLSLGSSPVSELRPQSSYSASVKSVLLLLDRERLVLRERMSKSPPPEELEGLASQLAGRYGEAVKKLDGIASPPVVANTQTALSHAMYSARAAYKHLAAAAGDEDLVYYEDSRDAVERAEREVNLELESMTLLGYGQSPSSS